MMIIPNYPSHRSLMLLMLSLKLFVTCLFRDSVTTIFTHCVLPMPAELDPLSHLALSVEFSPEGYPRW